MSWNYRVFEHWSCTPPSLVEKGYSPFQQWFGIHEAYYNEEGELDGHTDLINVSSENLDDIKGQLELMLGAMEKPVITGKFDDRSPK